MDRVITVFDVSQSPEYASVYLVDYLHFGESCGMHHLQVILRPVGLLGPEIGKVFFFLIGEVVGVTVAVLNSARALKYNSGDEKVGSSGFMQDFVHAE